ncbi:hypothetical protein D8S93_23570 [Vibrio sp. VGrn 2]|uniref:fimbrial protein n=1 Tax=Vibrio sp. VGrn 2 TaxID=2419839 RepID=UPI00128B4A3B|nr:fimbrial protein [Vibrio sp. VGrn 2]MPS41561.1 hypothetical protein [Vibrio sp. VGrn 2]
MKLSILVLLLASLSLHAKTLTSELIVSGNVESSTCDFILPADAISLGSYTTSDLVAGNTRIVPFDMTFDCTANPVMFNRIFVVGTPLGFSPGISSDTMQTNLNGVGVELSWFFSGAAAFVFGLPGNRFTNRPTDEFPVATSKNTFPLRAKAVHITSVPASNIEKGAFKAGVLFELRYE